MRWTDLVNRLSPRDLRALRLGLWGLLPALGWSGVASPLIRDFSSRTEAVRQERDLLRREAELIAAGPGIERALAQGTDLLTEAGTGLFEGVDAITAAAGLVAYVTERARLTEVTVRNTEPGSSVAAPGLTRLVVEVRAQGELTSVVRWLGELEFGDRLTRVREVVVAPPQVHGPADGAADVLALRVVVEGFALSPADSTEGGR